jgi:hypothetical protein
MSCVGTYLLPAYPPSKRSYITSECISGKIHSVLEQVEGLRRIFGPKRDEIVGDWRKQHNEKLRDLYYSPNIIRIIKSRRMKWVRACSTHTGNKNIVYRVFVGSQTERDH